MARNRVHIHYSLMVTGFLAVLLAVLLTAGLVSGFSGPAAASLPKVYVLSVQGTVEPGMAAYVRRALSRIAADDGAAVLLRLDTFGGRVDAAMEIVEAMSVLPPRRSFAYVEKRAISAGALIALSAGTLVMKENTLLGDCAPMLQTGKGMTEAGEKIQTVLRAQFRTLARRNGYPETLSEAMVSKDMEVVRILLDGEERYVDRLDYEEMLAEEKARITGKKTVVAKGELLTMDAAEAEILGFSRTSVPDFAAALSALGLAGREQIEITESWSERLVRTLQPFLPVLMLIGLGAVYAEIKAPGFGIPGITGILCLGLVFFNQYLVGLASYTELLFLITGILLLGVELFVLPGFGIAGLSGILAIAMGLVLSFQGFVIPDPAMPWEAGLMLRNVGMVTASMLGALLISFFLVRFVLPRIFKGTEGPYLSGSLAGIRAESYESGRACAGDMGESLTPLRPSGKIRIAAGKLDAVSQGDFIDPGLPVRVVAVRRNHVIVEKMEERP